MAWFKTLNVTDTADIQTLMGAANTISDNILMPLMLLTIYLVLFLGSIFSGKPIHRSLIFGSFVCSILAVLMVIMNWLAVNYMYFTFFMLAVGVIWTYMAEAYS
jgi:hypothetical protein